MTRKTFWKEDDLSKHKEMFDGQEDPLNLKTHMSKEERVRLCKPCRKVLILRLLGRKIGYKMLQSILLKLWSRVQPYELIDLQNDHFLVRFLEMRNYDFVLNNGHWVLFRHYLTIQKWRPEFNQFENPIKRIAIWIRVPGLPIEYYEEHLLWKIGNAVVKILKFYMNTIKEEIFGGESLATVRGTLQESVWKLTYKSVKFQELRLERDLMRWNMKVLALYAFSTADTNTRRSNVHFRRSHFKNSNKSQALRGIVKTT